MITGNVRGQIGLGKNVNLLRITIRQRFFTPKVINIFCASSTKSRAQRDTSDIDPKEENLPYITSKYLTHIY